MLICGCNKCGRHFCNVDFKFNINYARWKDTEYLFGIFKYNVEYKEEELCPNCLPEIKKKFSISNLRKRKIKLIK